MLLKINVNMKMEIRIMDLFIVILITKFKEKWQNQLLKHLYKQVQLIYCNLKMELINFRHANKNGVKYCRKMELGLILL